MRVEDVTNALDIFNHGIDPLWRRDLVSGTMLIGLRPKASLDT